jgi:hypothetical protein
MLNGLRTALSKVSPENLGGGIENAAEWAAWKKPGEGGIVQIAFGAAAVGVTGAAATAVIVDQADKAAEAAANWSKTVGEANTFLGSLERGVVASAEVLAPVAIAALAGATAAEAFEEFCENRGWLKRD